MRTKEENTHTSSSPAGEEQFGLADTIVDSDSLSTIDTILDRCPADASKNLQLLAYVQYSE